MKVKPKAAPKERMVFAPCSRKQQLILLDDSTDILLCGGGAGGGKALKHGEMVLTPRGFVPVESVRIGDVVCNPNGGTQVVTGVWPQGAVDIYRVTFQDGRSVEVCGEHLWQYHKTGRGLSSTRVGSTLEMKALCDSNTDRSRNYLPVVPLTSPVETVPNGLPIAPYTLGAILGDGYFVPGRSVSLTSADIEIVECIEKDGYEVSPGYCKTGTTAKAYYISGLSKAIHNLGLSGKKSATKFIPEAYIVASIEDRFALVNGLMDTDGYVSADGKTYFDSTSEALATGMQRILWSLGFSAKMTSKLGGYKTADGTAVECQKVYSLYIRGVEQHRLFKLARKVARCKDRPATGLRVDKVEFTGKAEATCISVSGDEHLFITTNFVVTHNSHTCLTKALKYINDPAARVLIVRRTYPMLKISGGLWDESKKIYRHFGGVPKIQKLTWEFPNGATIQFAAIPDDLSEWQGLQATNILVDESAEFTQEEILFLVSRLRGADYKGHLNVTMTCNPSRDSFLYEWVKYSLDETTGVPNEGTEDIVRYFINVGGKIYWSASKDDLWERYGEPMGLIRYHEDEKKINFLPMSFRFIPLTVKLRPLVATQE